jgi:Peptidase propeptide and YPEB domain
MFLHLKASEEVVTMLNKNFMIWRAILIAGMVIGVAGIVGEMVWSAEKGKSKEAEARQVIAMAASTKIGLEGAMKTALVSVPGQVIGAGLEKNGDKMAWNVEILTTEEAIMTVYVDAVSGSVMMTEEKVGGKRSAQGKTF